MKTPIVSVALLVLLPAAAGAAGVVADLPVPEQRRPIVEMAQRLAAAPALAPLPADLVQPFNPTAFGQPDPEELRAIAAARAVAAASSAQTQAQTKPTTDRALLELIASRITPSGTLILGDKAMLIFGQKRLRVGDRLTVTYDGRDYELELIGISPANFSLRLNQEEITRPIKPAKTP